MELILLQDVEKVGRKGDVVNVRDGFARNFLIPRSLGLASTRANKEFVEEQKVRAAKRHALEKEKALTKVKELERLVVTLQAASGDQDKLYGSVTSEDISKALSDKGYAVDKKRILIKEPIRTLGTHTVAVELYPQVKASVKVEIVRKP